MAQTSQPTTSLRAKPASAGLARGSYRSRPSLGLTLALPAFLLLAAVIVIPEAWALVLSLSKSAPGGTTFAGLQNYRAVLQDTEFWNSVRNTVLFVGVVVALQITLGVAVALLLGQGFPGQGFWIAMVLAPSAMSPAILGTTWKYTFNPDFGPLNFLLGKLGLAQPAWLSDPTVAMVAIVLVYVWNTLPQTFIFVYPALISIPGEYFEAARIDGAGPLQALRHITLPILRPAILVALIFRTIIAVRAFGEIFVLTKGGPFRATEVVSIYLYKEGFVYFSWGTAAAVGWVMLVLTLIIATPQINALTRQMFGRA